MFFLQTSGLLQDLFSLVIHCSFRMAQEQSRNRNSNCRNPFSRPERRVGTIRTVLPGTETGTVAPLAWDCTENTGNPSSGFLQRVLAPTCLRAWYQVRFLEVFLGILGALCKGKVAPLVRHRDTFLLSYFWAFLGGPEEGRGGAPGAVPLQNPKVTSRKACLRNADLLSGPLRLRVQSWSRTRLRIAASVAFLFRACFKGV